MACFLSLHSESELDSRRDAAAEAKIRARKMRQKIRIAAKKTENEIRVGKGKNRHGIEVEG